MQGNSGAGHLRVAFLAVGPAHLARGRRLQFLALSLRGRNPILDRLADRVFGVGDHLARPLRSLPSFHYRLAARQLDGLALEAVHLTSAWTRRDVRPGPQPDPPAQGAAAHTPAATVFIGPTQPPTTCRPQLPPATLHPWTVH